MLEVFVWVRREAIKGLERRKYGKHNSQRETWHDDEYISSYHIEKEKRLLLILKSHGKNNYSHMGFPSTWTDVWQNSNSSFIWLFALLLVSIWGQELGQSVNTISWSKWRFVAAPQERVIPPSSSFQWSFWCYGTLSAVILYWTILSNLYHEYLI